MKKLIIFMFLAVSALASEWTLKPHLYSRGGLTVNQQFSKKAANRNVFNLGAWGDESNAIRDNLTEITLEAFYDKAVKYVYGVDIQQNNRFFDGTPFPLNERLNYITFYEGNMSLWFGSRAYRGDGDYLMQTWPLDEHNLFGGGFRFEKVGPTNIEFAYGIKQESNPHTRNIFINKIEYPLKNGKIKSNIELHQINSDASEEKTIAFIIGGQYQRWGDKLLDGSLYNIVVLNFSHGNIYGGTMQTAFNSAHKDQLAQKILARWSGDWKMKKYGLYYAVQYQNHMGQETNQNWSFIDIYARPVYLFTGNITIGLDLAGRQTLKKENMESISSYMGNEWQFHSAQRISLMLAYNIRNKAFDGPSVRIFAGRMISEKNRAYFNGDMIAKADNFVRFDYEISF